MGKGQATKEHIVRQSAGLFNTKGYAGTSLSDIIARSEIPKGSVYNHFGTKDDIALGAFDYMFARLMHILREAMSSRSEPADKVLAICDIYIRLVGDNLIEGGCPILNAAVENDDGHPLLKQRAQLAMKELMTGLRRLIEDGKRSGQLRSDLDEEEASAVIVALIEGGVMLSKLFDDEKHIRHCTEQVKTYLLGSHA
jgi:AcrR family transcriptional regulator